MACRVKLCGLAAAIAGLMASALTVSEAHSRTGVRTKATAPKLVSTRVAESRRVTTQVGRPKVVSSVTRVATFVQRLPATRAAVGAPARQKPKAARSVAATTVARAASRTIVAAATPQALPNVIELRDTAKIKFSTGDFYEQ